MNKDKMLFKKQMKEDKLATTARKVFNFFQDPEGVKKFFNILIWVVIAVVAVTGYFTYRGNIDKQVEKDMKPAIRQYYDGEYDIAIKNLKKIYQNYPHSAYAGEVLYYMGESSYKLKNYDEAIKNFNEATGKSLREMIRPAVFIALAYTYEEKGDFIKAADTYETLSRKIPKYFAMDDVFIGRARCLKAAGKSDEAKKVYQDIITKYPESRHFQTAKGNLEN